MKAPTLVIHYREAMYATQFQFDAKESVVSRLLDAKRGQTPKRLGVYDIPARRRMDVSLSGSGFPQTRIRRPSS